ncbi:MAG: hypothetical protein JJT89_18325 [Nitriliruptoraceae bacterium]|nr:hypothetical protein [Nitriliruptoraceae bacterium]
MAPPPTPPAGAPTPTDALPGSGGPAASTPDIAPAAVPTPASNPPLDLAGFTAKGGGKGAKGGRKRRFGR